MPDGRARKKCPLPGTYGRRNPLQLLLDSGKRCGLPETDPLLLPLDIRYGTDIVLGCVGRGASLHLALAPVQSLGIFLTEFERDPSGRKSLFED